MSGARQRGVEGHREARGERRAQQLFRIRAGLAGEARTEGIVGGNLTAGRRDRSVAFGHVAFPFNGGAAGDIVGNMHAAQKAAIAVRVAP